MKMKSGRYVVRGMLLFALFLCAVTAASAFEAGGGVAVFVPESMYARDDGSISVQTALGTGLTINEFASIPIRVAYNQVYGLLPESAAYTDAAPWFYGDSVLGDIQLKLRIPINSFYIDAFGGGAANWLPGLKPLTKNIETSVAGRLDGIDQVSFDTFSFESGLGFGWLAGGGFGVRIDTISVDLSVTYITVSHPLTVTGSYYELPAGGTAVEYSAPSDLELRMRGFLIGVRASIAL